MKNDGLDFEIDDLTNSIRNIISGDSFTTEVLPLTREDLKTISKKNGWNFNWKSEFADLSKSVFKLTISNNSIVIQGLVSYSIEEDHIYMHLLENAPFNVGKGKIYEGVAGNLVAYICKTSFLHGHEGFVAFTAKTQLIKHYEQALGAYTLGGHRMIIPTDSSRYLVNKYFKY